MSTAISPWNLHRTEFPPTRIVFIARRVPSLRRSLPPRSVASPPASPGIAGSFPVGPAKLFLAAPFAAGLFSFMRTPRVLLVLALAFSSASGLAATPSVTLELWPGTPPGDEGLTFPPEADQTKPTDRLIAGIFGAA